MHHWANCYVSSILFELLGIYTGYTWLSLYSKCISAFGASRFVVVDFEALGIVASGGGGSTYVCMTCITNNSKIKIGHWNKHFTT